MPTHQRSVEFAPAAYAVAPPRERGAHQGNAHERAGMGPAACASCAQAAIRVRSSDAARGGLSRPRPHVGLRAISSSDAPTPPDRRVRRPPRTHRLSSECRHGPALHALRPPAACGPAHAGARDATPERRRSPARRCPGTTTGHGVRSDYVSAWPLGARAGEALAGRGRAAPYGHAQTVPRMACEDGCHNLPRCACVSATVGANHSRRASLDDLTAVRPTAGAVMGPRRSATLGARPGHG